VKFLGSLFKGFQKKEQLASQANEPGTAVHRQSTEEAATKVRTSDSQLTLAELVHDGIYKKRHGDYVGAKRSYCQAIRIDPTQRSPFYSLAKLCYLMGERQEAIVNYLRAAHLSLIELVETIASDPVFKRTIEQQLNQVPIDLRVKLRAVHRYAAYLLLDPDLPCHLAHAALDLDPFVESLSRLGSSQRK
jgi:tetratricopeptide (TPR) repeat protein